MTGTIAVLGAGLSFGAGAWWQHATRPNEVALSTEVDGSTVHFKFTDRSSFDNLGWTAHNDATLLEGDIDCSKYGDPSQGGQNVSITKQYGEASPDELTEFKDHAYLACDSRTPNGNLAAQRVAIAGIQSNIFIHEVQGRWPNA